MYSINNFTDQGQGYHTFQHTFDDVFAHKAKEENAYHVLYPIRIQFGSSELVKQAPNFFSVSEIKINTSKTSQPVTLEAKFSYTGVLRPQDKVVLTLSHYRCPNSIASTNVACAGQMATTWDIINTDDTNMCNITLTMKSDSSLLYPGELCIMNFPDSEWLTSPSVFVPIDFEANRIQAIQNPNSCHTSMIEHNESIRKSPGIGITFVEAKFSLSNNTFSAVPGITFRFRLSEALKSGQNITISLRGFGGSSFDSFIYIDIKKVFCGKSRWTSKWNPVSEKLTFWIHHGSLLQANKLCQLTFAPPTQNTWMVPSFENITVLVDTRSAAQRVEILTHFGFSLSFRSPLNIIPGIVGSVGNASINFVTENDLPDSKLTWYILKIIFR